MVDGEDLLSELGRAALSYVRAGFAVFPLRPGGKEPRTKNGLNDWTDDEESVVEVWTAFPDSNVGIVCGEPSGGLLVVDLDLHPERDVYGTDALGEWERGHGGLPETCTQVTGSGGYQLLFRVPPGTKAPTYKNSELGVDTRGDGGYIVAPPSVHPCGGTYQWEVPPDELEPQVADSNVLAFVDACRDRPSAADTEAPRYEAPEVISEGGRNDELTRVCGQAWGKGMDRHLVRDMLHGVNLARCVPPLPPEEVDRIWESITAKPKGHSPEWEAAHPKASQDDGEKQAQSPVSGVPQIVRFQDLCDDLPPRAPVLIDGVLRAGHKLMVAAQSKAGKTWMLLELAVSIASGEPWLGHEIAQPGSVLYVNLEIDEPSCYDRIMRICEAMGVDPHAMADLDVWPLRGAGMMMPGILSGLRDAGKGYSLIIVDPIYKVNDGDENNAADMARFCSMLDTLAASTGAAVAFAHHFAKGSAGGKVAMDRASGSGVFARDPDAIVTVSSLSLTDEAAAAADGRAPFRMEYTLREFPPMEPRDVWFAAPVHELDEDGVLASCPVEGSQGERSAKGVAAKASKNADRYAERNAFIGGAVRMCVDAGEEPTQTNVAKMLRGSECEGAEITYHKLKDWLKSRWCSYTLGEGGAVVLKDGRRGAA